MQAAEGTLISVGETVRDFHEIRQSMKSARHVRHLQMAGGGWEGKIVSGNEIAGQRTPLSETDLSPLYERLQYASEDEVEPILTEYTRSLDSTLALGYLRVAGLLTARRVIQELEGAEGFAHLDEYSDGTTERGKNLRRAIADKFHFASLDFQSLEGVVKAIGLDPCELCTYCWNGKE